VSDNDELIFYPDAPPVVSQITLHKSTAVTAGAASTFAGDERPGEVHAITAARIQVRDVTRIRQGCSIDRLLVLSLAGNKS